MKWQDLRDKSTQYAGNSFKLGNIALLGNSFYQAAINFSENVFDITNYSHLAFQGLTSALFIISANILKKKGHTYSGAKQGMSIASMGYGSLITSLLLSDSNPTALLGAFIGISACIGSTISTYLQEKNDTKKKIQKVSEFKENKSTILEEYPQALPMSLEFSANTAFTIGHLLQKDLLMSCVGALWASGAFLMGISKQTADDNIPPEKPQTAQPL